MISQVMGGDDDEYGEEEYGGEDYGNEEEE
jgi:hypothetical protein